MIAVAEKKFLLVVVDCSWIEIQKQYSKVDW